MSIKTLEAYKKELEEMNPRLVVSIGNYEDEVALYIKYMAGALKTFKDLPERYKGVLLIKEGLYKPPRRG